MSDNQQNHPPTPTASSEDANAASNQEKQTKKAVDPAEELDAVYNVPVEISAVLGHANMQVSQLLKLGRGAVVELDRRVGEPIDIYVNNRLVARGEVVVTDDKLGITMTEIMKTNHT